MNEQTTETNNFIPQRVACVAAAILAQASPFGRGNPTKPSRFAKVIPAPAYAHCPKNNRISKRRLHRDEVAARKAGLL